MKESHRPWAKGLLAMVFALSAVPLIVAKPPAFAVSVSAGPLKGVFSIKSGACALVGPPSGSYIQLVLHGLVLPNPNSPCPLTASGYTPLKSGTIGLVSGAYQSDPTPTFDGGGNSLANAIVTPVKFLGEGFGVATTCADQQHKATATGACTTNQVGFPVPQLYSEPLGTGGCKASLTNLTGVLSSCIYGNLEGLGVTYNGSHNGTCAAAASNSNGCYDTGVATGPSLSPTSCGSAPLSGCSMKGTFNAVTGAYTLDISSTIVGTSFNGAAAVFHLVGMFTPGIPSKTTSGEPPPSSPAPGSSSAVPPSATAPAGASNSGGSGASGRAMTGNFQITAGSCNGSAAPDGSWIQLGLGGSPITNPNSSCNGGAYTPVAQGTAGLVTGQFQRNPNPTFDANGNSLANAILAPATFLGSKFGAATDPQDEQTAPAGPAVFPAPAAILNGTTITANLSAVSFTYNGTPNGTCASGGGDGCYAVGAPSVGGTYDPTSRAYTMQWTTTVHGGAFNNATATFHLSGTFAGTIAASVSHLSQAGATVPAASASPVKKAVGQSVHAAGAAPPAQANELLGIFTLAQGACNGSGPPTGSWIQLSKGGGPIPNPSSTCDGGNYTPLSQGTTGLKTGGFQPEPTPTFDGNGNSLAGAILRPTKFLGADFGAGTDPRDEQNSPTGPSVFPAPYAVLSAGGRTFTANLSSVNFTYNGTPNGTCASGNGDGCYAVGSPDVAGTYDPSTHAYEMAWAGQVSGGAFNGATANFHLAGTFNGVITKVAASAVPSGSPRPAVSASASASASANAPTVPAPVATPAGGAPAQAAAFPISLRKSLPGTGWSPPVETAATILAAAAILAFAALRGGGRSKRAGLGSNP